VKGSFRRRVAGAAAMLVGFYLLAGLVAASLFGLVIAMWTTSLPQNLWISVACIGSGFAIVRGLLPRRAKWVDPGPRLTTDEQPELHTLVREVAESTGQTPPADVYLAPDVNAAVTDTGGLFGSGGRQVMIVGLPLLDVLTVGELRAVLAHEFGHYYGGDTRLGPWFFRTYDAIARTVVNLEQRESIWQKPFEWYGSFFLRRSAAIKRQQEFLADELAASAAGKGAAISSLRAVSAASPAFEGFWDSEVAPVLGSGARAPLLAGFRSFQSAKPVKRAVDEAVRSELEHGETDPYDTHPSLRDRVEALERLPDDDLGGNDGDDRPAIGLLRDATRAEEDLLVTLFGDQAAALELLRWEDVPERVIVPGWRGSIEPYRRGLTGITVERIPGVAAEGLEQFGRALPLPPDIPPEAGPFPGDLFVDIAASALDIGLALTLADSGWTATASPGEAIVLRQGERSIKPFGTAHALASGELGSEEWAVICAQAGIGGLPLGGQASATAPVTQMAPPPPPPPAAQQPASAG
jgi:heat shock protein HtpX